jgi:hypothetical protein
MLLLAALFLAPPLLALGNLARWVSRREKLYLARGLAWLTFFLLCCLPLGLMLRAFWLARLESRTKACQANLERFRTAVELYAADHEGRAPQRLNQLVPDYLKLIPDCPLGETASYHLVVNRQKMPERYTLFCAGRHRVQPLLGPSPQTR